MLKYNCLLFLFFLSYFSAQNLTVNYELIYKPSTSRKDSSRAKLFYLDILNKQSVFRDQMRRTSDSLISFGNGYGLGFPNNINDQLYIKKDLESKTILKYFVMPLSRDIFYVKISDDINWQLYQETKDIGGMNCQKAETEYGGRKWTAYFTKDIQVSEGPYVFNGLPGLILEIYDDKKDFLFRMVKIKKYNKTDLFPMKKGKEVSWDELKKIQKDYYADPFSFAKIQNIKVMTDDGNGEMRNVNLREGTNSIQQNLKEYNNVIELDKKISW